MEEKIDVIAYGFQLVNQSKEYLTCSLLGIFTLKQGITPDSPKDFLKIILYTGK